MGKLYEEAKNYFINANGGKILPKPELKYNTNCPVINRLCKYHASPINKNDPYRGIPHCTIAVCIHDPNYKAGTK